MMLLACVSPQAVWASQIDIVGPAGSGSFGSSVTVLPNGNIVVVDTGYDLSGPTVTDVGAVHLYNGANLALISTITGSTASDQVGIGGITVLTNGNYVIRSQNWDNPSPLRTDVGAVTWCSATTGCSGVVSASNSLIGGTAGDAVGISVTALTNGNYVIRSLGWDNPSPAAVDAGAVTWGNGTTGTFGLVSASNSLVGSTASDQVGLGGVTALTNGNYVVSSFYWDNPSPLITDAGAVTWGNGTSGTAGLVSTLNSLIGGLANDQVGNPGVTALTNGNYVVSTLNLDNPSPLIADVGAVTWGNGTTGTVGVVTASNSLVGGTANDQVGSGITVLTNGNYVVRSALWDNPSSLITEAGAVTWGNGTTGTVGLVSASNSLIGGRASDVVGSNGITALSNGNYVVMSPDWDNPSPVITNVGAATWGNGAGGTVGLVSASNSLIGGRANDRIGGDGVTALTNGNYVVMSAIWDNPSPVITNVGAATWGNGTTGTVGLVSASNSLVGGTASDAVGGNGVTALTNGNYVVRSQNWDNPSPAAVNAGAVTWGNGTTGTVGLVSASNSHIGGTASDLVGSRVTALTNGNYVVTSENWDNPSPLRADVGAVTWGNGAGGTVGLVSASNSLVGGTASDFVGGGGVTALTNGNYVVGSQNWDNPSLLITNVGAATWCNGLGGTVGLVSASNSLVGGTAADLVGNFGVGALTNGNYVVRTPDWDNPSPVIANATAVTYGNGISGTNGLLAAANSVVGTIANGTNTFSYDATRNRLFVGRSASNIVSVLFFNTTATSNGTFSTAGTWDNGVPNSFFNGVIPNGRTVTLGAAHTVGLLSVGCTGAIAGASSTNFIRGSIQKDYCAAASETFNYPLGETANYSPMSVSNLSGTGSLLASVTDALMPGLSTTQSATRFWTLSGTGVTADLSFTYVDGDVVGNEANYKVFKRSGGVTSQVTPFSINTTTNTITATGVSSFSDWGVGNSLAPTAAGVSVSGRVLTSDGAGLRNAFVTLTGVDGITRRATTSSFGYYRLDGVEVGQTYIIGVSSKRYTFVPRAITVADELMDVDLIALPQ